MPYLDMQTEITLSLRLPDGQAVQLARTQNLRLVRRVARQAVVEAEQRARDLRRVNPILGKLGDSEARRLGRAMQTILGEAT